MRDIILLLSFISSLVYMSPAGTCARHWDSSWSFWWTSAHSGFLALLCFFSRYRKKLGAGIIFSLSLSLSYAGVLTRKIPTEIHARIEEEREREQDPKKKRPCVVVFFFFFFWCGNPAHMLYSFRKKLSLKATEYRAGVFPICVISNFIFPSSILFLSPPRVFPIYIFFFKK